LKEIGIKRNGSIIYLLIEKNEREKATKIVKNKAERWAREKAE